MGGATGMIFHRRFLYSLRNRIRFAAKADDVSRNAKRRTQWTR